MPKRRVAHLPFSALFALFSKGERERRRLIAHLEATLTTANPSSALSRELLTTSLPPEGKYHPSQKSARLSMRLPKLDLGTARKVTLLIDTSDEFQVSAVQATIRFMTYHRDHRMLGPLQSEILNFYLDSLPVWIEKYRWKSVDAVEDMGSSMSSHIESSLGRPQDSLEPPMVSALRWITLSQASVRRTKLAKWTTDDEQWMNNNAVRLVRHSGSIRSRGVLDREICEMLLEMNTTISEGAL